MRKTILIVALAGAASACGDIEQSESELACTGSDFGAIVFADCEVSDGQGFVQINEVSGGNLSELNFEWDTGATGP